MCVCVCLCVCVIFHDTKKGTAQYGIHHMYIPHSSSSPTKSLGDLRWSPRWADRYSRKKCPDTISFPRGHALVGINTGRGCAHTSLLAFKRSGYMIPTQESCWVFFRGILDDRSTMHPSLLPPPRSETRSNWGSHHKEHYFE